MRIVRTIPLALASLAVLACRTEPTPATRPPAGSLDRTSLPIPTPATPVITTLDARDATAPPMFRVTAPKGAPNFVFILIDDMGFGQPSAFGGEVPMPVLDSLAGQGLRYNRFHTTALCSPTRMALLTGRNHHTVNTGAVMEIATAFTGNTGIRPLATTPVAEILRQNGYSTAAYGKYHETPPWEVSVSGSFDRWPTHSGFDKFYGFIGGETNQFSPLLYPWYGARRTVARSEVSHHHRHHQQGDRLDARAARAHPRQAFLHLLRAGRHARAAPGAQGMDREVQGEIRRRLGQVPRRRRSRARSRWASCRRALRWRRSPRPSRTGTTLTPARARRCSRARWKCSPASRRKRTTRSAVCSNALHGDGRRRQHAGLLRRRATMARAPRAAWWACSTRSPTSTA